MVPIDRTATISVEIGIDGLNNLNAICNGFGAFILEGVKDAYGSGSTSTVVCTKGQGQEQRRHLQGGTTTPFLDYEKPVLITVTTRFPNYRTAPRQFGFLEFLEELVVSDTAIRELPKYIQQALGTTIDGVHVTVVSSKTSKTPVLIVAFGEDAPTASPTVTNTTKTPGSASGAEGHFQEYLLSLLLSSVVGCIMLM